MISIGPYFINIFIENYGWRIAYRILSIIILVFNIIALILIRDRPENIGLLPDGKIEKEIESIEMNLIPEGK